MPNENPTIFPVSVVIVNYNAGKWLLRSVISALAQADEVIIVDNASSDDSLLLIENECAGDTRVVIVRSHTNEGFAKACNKGAQISTSPFILFLNPDCALQANAINQLMMTLENNSTAGMVGGVLVNEEGIEQRGGRRQIPNLKQAFLNSLGLSRFFGDFNQHKAILPKTPISVEAISGAMMMLKRETFMSINGFDERYFLHCEDLDLCMRIRQAQWTILFVPKAIGIHGKGVCSRSRPLFVLWNKHKGMAYFYKKFYQTKHSILLRLFVTIGIWVRFGLSAMQQFLAYRFHQLFKTNHV